MQGAIAVKRVASLLLLTHGLGILAGFAVFYSFFQTQCADLLVARETSYNRTVKLIRNECESRANEEIFACQQTLLAEQSAFAGNQQNLMHARETALIQLTSLQSELDGAAATIRTLEEETQQLRQRAEQSELALTNAKRWATKQQEMLKGQLALTKTMLQERTDEVELLKHSEVSQCNSVANESETASKEELVQLQASIRRRSVSHATQLFGEAPFRIQFGIAAHHNHSFTSMFEVEIGALQEMPHTVYTFLSLVDAGLYHGTSIERSNDGASVTGGNPKDSIQKHGTSQLLRRYAELGYGTEPLLFTEVSLAPCEDLAFGISGRGPDFAIRLDGSRLEPFTCLGRVVDGRESLSALPKGEPISIIDARIVTI